MAGGSGGGDDEPTLEPDRDKPAKRTKGYERTVERAIDDIQEFWADEFPALYGGEYEPIPDSRIFAAEPGIELPDCQGETLTYQDAENNAFYCYLDNFIAYDDVSLFPQLFRDFGEFSIALVLAHEWGHAIQDRSDNADQATVLKELQADCFAGAWVGHVAAGDSKLEIEGGNLDTGIAAMLQFRDVPGSSPNDPGAHGSGFDRISAFQQGFDERAETCAAYFDTPPVIVQIPFTEEDLATGGNLPADDVVPATVDLLNDFFTQGEPAYVPLTIDDLFKYDSSGKKDQFPECGGQLDADEIANRVFYCDEGPYIAFDEPYLQHVYDDIGDFGVTTLLADTWATYVQNLQGFPGVEDNADNAILGADCYAGGFTAAMFREVLLIDPETGQAAYRLSGGDLDETIQAFIDQASAEENDDPDATFNRVRAFRDGFLNGAQVCQLNYGDPDLAIDE